MTSKSTQTALEKLEKTLTDYVYASDAFDMDLRISVMMDEIKDALDAAKRRGREEALKEIKDIMENHNFDIEYLDKFRELSKKE